MGTLEKKMVDLESQVVDLIEIDQTLETINSLEREMYNAVTRPLGYGDVISLVHKGTNTIVLKFRL